MTSASLQKFKTIQKNILQKQEKNFTIWIHNSNSSTKLEMYLKQSCVLFTVGRKGYVGEKCGVNCARGSVKMAEACHA